jgi:hypothetical protein
MSIIRTSDEQITTFNEGFVPGDKVWDLPSSQWGATTFWSSSYLNQL